MDAASGANLAMQAENAQLRAELAVMQQRLAGAGAAQQLLISRHDAEGGGDEAPAAKSAANQLVGSCEDAKPGNDKAAATAEEQGATEVDVGKGEDADGKGDDADDDKGDEEETTPAKQPSAQAALASQGAAAHAAPVAFYGSHRVFMAPRPVATGAGCFQPTLMFTRLFAATPLGHASMRDGLKRCDTGIWSLHMKGFWGCCVGVIECCQSYFNQMRSWEHFPFTMFETFGTCFTSQAALVCRARPRL